MNQEKNSVAYIIIFNNNNGLVMIMSKPNSTMVTLDIYELIWSLDFYITWVEVL